MFYSLGEREVEVRGECYVAPSASVIGSVVLEPECSIWFNAVLRADNDRITIGAGTNIQDGAVLHVDPGVPLSLGRKVTVGHKAMVHGCTVGDNCLIGINSAVLNHAVIGENSLVGANALVPEGKEIPPGSLVVGTPCKVIRRLTDEQIAGLTRIADGYIARAEEYRRLLRAQT